MATRTTCGRTCRRRPVTRLGRATRRSFSTTPTKRTGSRYETLVLHDLSPLFDPARPHVIVRSCVTTLHRSITGGTRHARGRRVRWFSGAPGVTCPLMSLLGWQNVAPYVDPVFTYNAGTSNFADVNKVSMRSNLAANCSGVSGSFHFCAVVVVAVLGCGNRRLRDGVWDLAFRSCCLGKTRSYTRGISRHL